MAERIIEVKTPEYHFKGPPDFVKQRIGMVRLLDRADKKGPLVGGTVTIGLGVFLLVLLVRERFLANHREKNLPVKSVSFPSLDARRKHTGEMQPS